MARACGLCAANIDSIRAGTLKVDAAYTAKMLRITTRDECAKAGGRFVPRIFGWMAHVYLFAGDDPVTIWGGDDHGSMDVHMHHPRSSEAVGHVRGTLSCRYGSYERNCSIETG